MNNQDILQEAKIWKSIEESEEFIAKEKSRKNNHEQGLTDLIMSARRMTSKDEKPYIPEVRQFHFSECRDEIENLLLKRKSQGVSVLEISDIIKNNEF